MAAVPTITTRKYLFVLATAAIVAFGLRFWASFEMYDEPAVRAPPSVTDMATYHSLARRILGGEVPEEFYYQPFYYAVFLPAVMLLPGATEIGLIIVQAMLGAATVYLAGLTAGRCFGRIPGVCAAVLLTAAELHIFYTPFALIAVLQGFWIILLLYLSVRAISDPAGWRWALAGLVCGVAILTRGNVWFLVPVVLGGLVWRARREARVAAAYAFLFLILCCLPQLPFAARNLRATGRWTGPSTAAGAVLALGNNPEAPPGALTYPPTYEYWMRSAKRDGPDRVPVARRILRWVKREPLAFCELKLRTFLLFWNRIEIPNNVMLEREGRDSLVLRIPVLAGFGFIGTLGLSGLIFGVFRHSRNTACLTVYGFIGMYCLATVVFYMLARFRLPIVPVLCVSSGGLTGDLIRLVVYRHRTRRLTAFAAVVTGSAVLVLGGFQLYRVHAEKLLVRLTRPSGVVTAVADGVTRIYDHGPRALGVWQPIPWRYGSMLIRKDFHIPERYAGKSCRISGVRLPVLTRSEAEFELLVRCGNSDWIRREFKVEPSRRRPTWLEIEIPAEHCEPLDKKTVSIVFAVRSQSEVSEVLTFVDMQRDYGRTAIILQSREPVTAPGEFTAEIDLRCP